MDPKDVSLYSLIKFIASSVGTLKLLLSYSKVTRAETHRKLNGGTMAAESDR